MKQFIPNYVTREIVQSLIVDVAKKSLDVELNPQSMNESLASFNIDSLDFLTLGLELEMRINETFNCRLYMDVDMQKFDSSISWCDYTEIVLQQIQQALSPTAKQ